MTYFAFRVTPQREFAAVEALKRRGHAACVPYEVRFLRRHGKDKTKVERSYPLLVGYVLVEMREPYPWASIFQLDLIKSVVGFGGIPAPLNTSQVLRMLAQSGHQMPHTHSVNQRKSLAAGDTATLNGHGFAAYPVRVEEIKGERAMVMLEFFGTERKIAVRLETLKAA